MDDRKCKAVATLREQVSGDQDPLGLPGMKHARLAAAAAALTAAREATWAVNKATRQGLSRDREDPYGNVGILMQQSLKGEAAHAPATR